MSKFIPVSCPMCNKSLLIGYDLPNGDSITGSCFCINEKKNTVLTMLREAGGVDVRPSLFIKKGQK